MMALKDIDYMEAQASFSAAQLQLTCASGEVLSQG